MFLYEKIAELIMAQTTQIVPKFSFPYVETVINDYTLVRDPDEPVAPDTSIRQAYAIISSKGIDNVWVRKSSRKSAVKMFGESNYKLYGQPYMQALHVLEQYNSRVWFMRVMPENADYSNAYLSAYYKIDTDADVEEAHLRKFRIKLTRTSFEDVVDESTFEENFKKFDGPTTTLDGATTYVDDEGYAQKQILALRYTGRGKCGDFYSLRLSQATTYEKEYGIKMYNYEVIDSENSIQRDANYVAAFCNSKKYEKEASTLVDDVILNVETGVAPIFVITNEDNVEFIYDQYVAFLKQLHTDSEAEYEEKLDEYQIPQDMLDGLIPVTDEYLAQYQKLKEIDAVIEATDDSNIPDIDEFDFIFGRKVAKTNDFLPNFVIVQKLTEYVDTEAEDYDPADYSEDEKIVNVSSSKGIILEHGDNGYFDNPRTEIVDGKQVVWTLDDEIEDCYKKAFNGTYDKKILSKRRTQITCFFDANYPFSVKETIVDLASARWDCRVFLDVGFIDNLSKNTLDTLVEKYGIFDNHMVSVDIHHYKVIEPSTNKKVDVTINYFNAAEYVNHLNNVGFQYPFVFRYAQLSGHVKDSMLPIIDEYDTTVKDFLVDNRFNYYECLAENVFQRGVQNTTQKSNTDLLEESNSTILFTLKRNIENDAFGELYNFAESYIRQNFIEVEKAKYNSWIGSIVENFDIRFATSRYEFEHSILHCYLEVTFRGLTKQVIVEIDLNKRQYPSSEETEE